ncbi:MAG: D-2-hydroxyacid dehydrogenase [Candidatus Cohnella colombiensis]|uniref:D-2-hydroxyacid dehydrogenase n=1 Tax=Candidatus Cohnella colombiensis TaxID=3121368 RepID=A0AA95JDA7_9BACL|nr:MAG: D-2-hydroxyacid dehydrogenase [Cohnella sp.]
MNIVVLDGYTLNPGDLSWGRLEKLGRVTVYDRTPANEIVSRSSEADIILTNKTPLTAETIANLPRLRYIGVLATGYNIVDIQAAQKADILVTNVPGYSRSSVAQLTFALLLELCLHVGKHNEAIHQGKWANSPDFSFTVSPLSELQGKTFGVVGFGDIGQAVAQIALAFGMRVVVASRTRKQDNLNGQIEWLDLPELLSTADVISLHCPLTASTERLIRYDTLKQMKQTAYLLNTSRGGLVDELDLANALNEGAIAGCGLDVLSSEPPQTSNPLLTARNCILTPHIAWASKEARIRLLDIAVTNVEAFLEGDPVHLVIS